MSPSWSTWPCPECRQPAPGIEAAMRCCTTPKPAPHPLDRAALTPTERAALEAAGQQRLPI